MIKTDWFNSILNYLYTRPMDGRYYDFTKIVNESDYGIRFDNKEDFERLGKVIVHLKDIGYINLNYKNQKGFEKACITALDGVAYSENYIDCNFTNTILSGTLTVKGYNYMLEAKRLEQQHNSIIGTNSSVRRTNIFIALTFAAVAVAAGLQYYSIRVTHADAVAQREAEAPKQQLKEQASTTQASILSHDSTQNSLHNPKK